ncbi:hypothetical protein C4566_01080 [Candidatus Parcubacteria bacterium]|nr:MAG: hypothetical protein C4566_01080 [Candidatus Parcubacteria bacterium]
MNKKILIIIIVLILLLAGGFLLYKYWPSDQLDKTNSNISSTNTSLPSGGEGGSDQPDGPAIVQIGENYLNIPFLENLSSEETLLLQRSDNYLALSNLRNICERKETPAEKDDCLATLKIRQVSILDNPELCNQLSGEKKDVCFKNMAYKGSDYDLCAYISNQETKKTCQDDMLIAKAKKDKNILLCLDLAGDIKNICISSVLSGETDVSYCEVDTVKNNSLTDICQSIIYSNQAFAQGDRSICENIPLSDYKEGCLGELQGL